MEKGIATMTSNSISCLLHTKTDYLVKFPHQKEDLEYKNDLKRLLLNHKKEEFISYWKENPGEKFEVLVRFTEYKMRILHADLKYFLLMNPNSSEFLVKNMYYGFLGEEFIERAKKQIKS